MSEIWEKAYRLIQGKKLSYERTFDGPDGRAVLKDLALFCRANETCFHEDARLHAVIEGRREVWLRIQKYLNLTNEELMNLYRKE